MIQFRFHKHSATCVVSNVNCTGQITLHDCNAHRITANGYRVHRKTVHGYRVLRLRNITV